MGRRGKGEERERGREGKGKRGKREEGRGCKGGEEKAEEGKERERKGSGEKGEARTYVYITKCCRGKKRQFGHNLSYSISQQICWSQGVAIWLNDLFLE